MGNWTIVVTGNGAHHNTQSDGTGLPGDADKLLDDFIAQLMKAGQFIVYASITTSSRQDRILREDCIAPFSPQKPL